MRPRFSQLRTSTLVACTAALLLPGFFGCKSHKKPSEPKARYAALPDKQVPDFLKDTIFERTDLLETDPLPVSAYGVVSQLRGTGDNRQLPTAVRDHIVKQMVKNGVGSQNQLPQDRVMPEELLNSPTVAVVRVDAYIPPGARVGDRIDVQTSVLDGSSTSSLSGGKLWRVELKQDGANPIMPSYKVDVLGLAEGPILVNPSYVLGGPNSQTPSAKASLRYGLVMNGGICDQNRALALRLRQPQRSLARAIEFLIEERFAPYKRADEPTERFASAKDEGIVLIQVPYAFRGDWERFTNIVTHLYLNPAPNYRALKAKQLAEEALKPGAPLMDISYCWEALGAVSLPYLEPLMGHQSPDVAYAAARAAAYLGDSAAVQVLMGMARTADHPFQLNAVKILGDLPSSPMVNEMLRSLLDSPQTLVRIEAYKVLARNSDPSIYSREIRGKFVLDIVPSQGKPLIHASRSGVPRIAIIGNKPALNLPAMFSAIDDQLSISSTPGRSAVTIFYRGPGVAQPVKVVSNPDIAEIIARMGGEGAADERQLNFSYGDIVAVIQAICQSHDITALAQGQRIPASFVMQEMPGIQDTILNAPVIGGETGRPQ